MTVSVIGSYTGASNIVGATAVTCQVGDMFIAYVYRTTSNTTPASLPSSGPWVSIGTRTGTSAAGSSARFMKAVATSTTIDISQTFTNATSMVVVHLRPSSGKMIKIGTLSGGNGSGTTITLPTMGTFEDTSGNSAVLLTIGIKGITSNVQTAPSGFSNIVADINATDEWAAHITGGVTGYSTQSYNISGSGAQGHVYELLELMEINPVADFFDDFNRSNQNLDATGAWTTFTGTPSVYLVKSNKLSYVGTADTVIHAQDNKVSDMFVEATVQNITGSSGCFSMVVRHQDIDNYLGLRWNNASLELIPRLGASFDLSLPSMGTVAIGDVLRLEVAGGTATVYKNGASAGTYSGSFIRQLTSTKAGVVGRNLTNWDPHVDDWKTGPLNPPSTGITGTMASTLSVTLTAAMTGNVDPAGTMAATIAPSLVLAASGTVSAPAVTGTMASTIAPTLTFAGSGTYAPAGITGTLAATIAPTLSAAFSGSVQAPVTGTMAAPLDILLGFYAWETLPSGQRDPGPPERIVRRQRLIILDRKEEEELEEEGEKIARRKWPARKKRKKFAREVAEEVAKEAGIFAHVDEIYAAILPQTVGVFQSGTETVDAELQAALDDIIQAAEAKAAEIRASEEEDEEILLMAH